MNVPFSADVLTGVFTSYNLAVWPAQLVLLAVALALVAGVAFGRVQPRVVYAVLAGLWGWSGGVFWLLFFTRVSPAGYVFGAFFLVQVVVFVIAAAGRDRQPVALRGNAPGVAGATMIVYALALYPLIGRAFGHVYPAVPTFGAPCPVTILTFGILVLAQGVVPVRRLLIPLAWSLVGTVAAVRFGVVQDLALPLAGIAGTAIVVLNNRRAAAAGMPTYGVGETPAPPEGIRRLH